MYFFQKGQVCVKKSFLSYFHSFLELFYWNNNKMRFLHCPNWGYAIVTLFAFTKKWTWLKFWKDYFNFISISININSKVLCLDCHVWFQFKIAWPPFLYNLGLLIISFRKNTCLLQFKPRSIFISPIRSITLSITKILTWYWLIIQFFSCIKIDSFAQMVFIAFGYLELTKFRQKLDLLLSFGSSVLRCKIKWVTLFQLSYALIVFSISKKIVH